MTSLSPAPRLLRKPWSEALHLFARVLLWREWEVGVVGDGERSARWSGRPEQVRWEQSGLTQKPALPTGSRRFDLRDGKIGRPPKDVPSIWGQPAD